MGNPTRYPFNQETIEAYRFHGVLNGQVHREGKLYYLTTSFGVIPLNFNTWQVRRGLRKQLAERPNEALFVYGYPRVNHHCRVDAMVACSYWELTSGLRKRFADGISRNFTPNQPWLCGRVQEHRSGVVKVNVKSVRYGRPRKWRIWGHCDQRLGECGDKVLFQGDICPFEGVLTLQPHRVVKQLDPKWQRLRDLKRRLP